MSGRHHLLAITATLDPGLPGLIQRGLHPRKDYLELARALDADIIDLAAVDRSVRTRVLRRLVGPAVAQADLAARLADQYEAVFADGEHIGLPLSLMLRRRRQRPRLVMIGHFLSPLKKVLFLRLFRMHGDIDAIILHSPLQQRIAQERLGLPASKLHLVPYQVDSDFWRPIHQEPRNLICSAGLEFRDYPTLMKAAEGLDVEVIIAAASYWSRRRDMTKGRSLPPNVRVNQSLDYLALRDLYAQSRFVVIPLCDVEFQAGITTILEAMSMAKAVIVTQTRGRADGVRGPLVDDSGGPLMVGDGLLPSDLEGAMGIFVPPGSPAALRQAIRYLLDHPQMASAMGANGRKAVLEGMNIDHFVYRVQQIVRGDPIQDAMPVAPGRGDT